MPKTTRSHHLSWIALALAAISPHTAHAEDAAPATTRVTADAAEGSDIIVTARKRSEKLQDAPISISAVDGATLAREQLNRVSDYAAKLPNFQGFQQNPRVSALLVRGIGGNANSDGSESGVGLIVDGVFYTHVGFSWLDLVDLEQVEVVRGPQGTLLGKNTTVGAVNVTTAKPSFEPSATIGATIANNARYQTRLNATGPVIPDVLAYRLTFNRDEGEGWIRNQVDNEKYLDVDRWGLRGQLLYDAGGPVTSRLIVERTQSSEFNNFYPPAGDVTTFANGAPRANSWTNRLVTRFGYTPSFAFPDNANLDTQERIKQHVTGASNELNWSLGDYTLTSVTAWRKLYFRPKNDSDGTPFPIFRSGYDVDVEQRSQELRLASPEGGAFDYQIGAYYLDYDVASQLNTSFFADGTKFFLSPLLPSATLDGLTYSQRGETSVTSAAVFGQGNWKITDRAALTLGLRYTDEIRSASNTGFSQGGASALPTAVLANRAALLSALGGTFRVADKKRNGGFAWLINPSYKISPNVLAYASASYGEKSGAANLGATPGRPVIIRPETSQDYEFGVKTTFARGFFNANLYWNDLDDYQATQTDPARPLLGSFLGNAAQVRLRGVEVEGGLKLTDTLSLNANGAYNDAEFVSYKNAPAPIEFTYPGGPTTVDASGRQIPGAPRWSGQISANYDKPVSETWRFTAYGNVRGRSETPGANAVSSYGIVKAYAVANLGVGVRRVDDRFAAELWVKNAFDEIYPTAFGAPGASTPLIAILGEPRTFGLTLTAKLQ